MTTQHVTTANRRCTIWMFLAAAAGVLLAFPAVAQEPEFETVLSIDFEDLENPFTGGTVVADRAFGENAYSLYLEVADQAVLSLPPEAVGRTLRITYMLFDQGLWLDRENSSATGFQSNVYGPRWGVSGGEHTGAETYGISNMDRSNLPFSHANYMVGTSATEGRFSAAWNTIGHFGTDPGGSGIRLNRPWMGDGGSVDGEDAWVLPQPGEGTWMRVTIEASAEDPGSVTITMEDTSEGGRTRSHTKNIGVPISDIWFFGGRDHATAGGTPFEGIWVDNLLVEAADEAEPGPDVIAHIDFEDGENPFSGGTVVEDRSFLGDRSLYLAVGESAFYEIPEIYHGYEITVTMKVFDQGLWVDRQVPGSPGSSNGPHWGVSTPPHEGEGGEFQPSTGFGILDRSFLPSTAGYAMQGDGSNLGQARFSGWATMSHLSGSGAIRQNAPWLGEGGSNLDPDDPAYDPDNPGATWVAPEPGAGTWLRAVFQVDDEGVAAISLTDIEREISRSATRNIGGAVTQVWAFGGTGSVLGGVWIDEVEIVGQAPVLPTLPEILAHPQDRVVDPGGTATFTVSAVGEDLEYQWRFRADTGTEEFDLLEGADGPELEIQDVGEADVGLYSVIVSNIHGEEISDEASLTLGVSPTIETHPVAVDASLGQSVSMSVEASGPDLSYQWMRGGQPITGFSVPQDPENLLVNANFEGEFDEETGMPEGWNVIAAGSDWWSVSEAEGFEGSTAVLLEWESKDGRWGPILNQYPPFERGASYLVSMRFRTPPGVDVSLQVTNAPFHDWSRLLVQRNLNTGDEWGEVSYSFTVDIPEEESPTALHVRLEAGTAGGGQVWIDEISLYEVEDTAKTATLMIDQVGVVDAGIYTVAVSNPAGTVVSNPAELRITGVPTALLPAEDMGNFIWMNEWFGLLYTHAVFNNWINSDDHGWIYVWPGQPAGEMWAWDPGIAMDSSSDGYVYITAADYPFIYIDGLGWGYFSADDSDRDTRAIFIYRDEEWVDFGLWIGPMQWD